MFFNKKQPTQLRKQPPVDLADLIERALSNDNPQAVYGRLAELLTTEDQYYYEDFGKHDRLLNRTHDLADPIWFDTLKAIFDDPSIFEERIGVTLQDDNKWKRVRTYQAMGWYGKANPDDQRPVTFIIANFTKERTPFDQSMVVDALDGLAKPPSVDLAPIIALTTSRNFDLRGVSIRVLDNAPGHDIEPVLLAAIKAYPNDSYTLNYALHTLIEYVTEASLPTLKPYLTNSSNEVSGVALYAWSKVRGKQDTPLYIELLDGLKGSLAKWWVMQTIELHGDERAIPIVIERARTILKRKRTINVVGDTEIISALNYLEKYRSDHPEINELIVWMRARPEGYLYEAEADWLAKHGL